MEKSHILKPLLDRSDFDEIFSKLDTDSEAHSKNKVDYVEFWKFCKATAANLEVLKMKEKVIDRIYDPGFSFIRSINYFG